MTQVFISYSHQDDKQFVEELENYLEKAGFQVWTDQDLHAGENWRKEIDEAIHHAFVLVLVITPHAKVSEFVTYEWAYAMGVGVPILPILLRDTPLHPKLDDLQYLDCRDDIVLDGLLDILLDWELKYLMKALKNSDLLMREKAIRRIGVLNYEPAVPQLIRIMQKDRSRQRIRPLAAKVLEQIGTPEALEAVKKWRES